MTGMKSSIPMSFGEKTTADFSFSVQRGEGDFFCAPHWHDCFELFYVRGGRFGISVGESELVLGVGDVAVFPPRTLHGTQSLGEPYENYVFGYTNHLISTPDLSYVNRKYLSPFFRKFRPEEHVIPAHHPDSSELRRKLEAALSAERESGFVRELRVRATLLEVHAILCRCYGEQLATDRANGYLGAAAEYIEGHMAKKLSPSALADALHLSYSHLARLVHSHLGYSVGELILRMKMNRAEQMMLSEPGKDVSAIASAVGYSDASYFVRCFRRVRGCSPGAFRKKYAL